MLLKTPEVNVFLKLVIYSFTRSERLLNIWFGFSRYIPNLRTKFHLYSNPSIEILVSNLLFLWTILYFSLEDMIKTRPRCHISSLQLYNQKQLKLFFHWRKRFLWNTFFLSYCHITFLSSIVRQYILPFCKTFCLSYTVVTQ